MILNIVLVALLSGTAELFLPWWSMAIGALAVGGWRGNSGWNAFNFGFAGGALLWLSYSGFIHFKSGGILTSRIGDMLQLPWSFLVLLLAAVLGGLITGLSSATGYHLRQLFKKAG